MLTLNFNASQHVKYHKKRKQKKKKTAWLNFPDPRGVELAIPAYMKGAFSSPAAYVNCHCANT